MRKLLLTVCFFAILSLLMVSVQAQSVTGKVVDAITGNAIAHASIYLKGTSKGTISNTQGEFILHTDETKKPLVVSYVGYQSETIPDYNNKLLTIKLKPRTNELKEVVIGSSGMSWEEKLQIFITQFIGSNSKDCIITNTDDINLRYQKKTKTLEGESTQPLVIYNKKLGYKITYSLSAFSYSLKKKETSYKGNYVFEEDTLGLKPNEIEKILKARDNAYYGSRMHFIRSVWARDPEKDKFWYAYNNLEDPTHYNFFFNNIKANKQQLLNNTSNIALVNGINHFLQAPCMVIKFNDGYESHLSFERRTKDEPVTPISYNESNLILSGKLAEQRVGDLLPIDFEPSEPLLTE